MTLKNQIMTLTLFALIVGVVVFMFPATPTQAQDGAVRYRSVRIDNALTVGGNSTMAGSLTVVGGVNFGDTTADVATITSLTANTITATTLVSQTVNFSGTTATITNLVLGGQTQSGAVRYGTAATYTTGASIVHGFTVTPTVCIASPARDVTSTLTITTTGFSWDTASRATPIFWVCGK